MECALNSRIEFRILALSQNSEEKGLTTVWTMRSEVRFNFSICVWAAGSVAGAAADPSVEELPGLHGGCRLVDLLSRASPSLQGPVISGLSLLIPNQRSCLWISNQTSLHHRSPVQDFESMVYGFLFTCKVKYFILLS